MGTKDRPKIDESPETFIARGWAKIVQVLGFRPASLAGPRKRRGPTVCRFCKTGQVVAARVSVVSRWVDTSCLVKGVPADVCMDCGRYTVAQPEIVRVQDLLMEDAPQAMVARMAEISYRTKRTKMNLRGRLEDELGVRCEVRLLNLSTEGSMIEHAERVSPGVACTLHICPEGINLSVRGQVAWTRIHSPETPPSEGDVHPLFRSGLQFLDLPDETDLHLRRYLATVVVAPPDSRNGLG